MLALHRIGLLLALLTIPAAAQPRAPGSASDSERIRHGDLELTLSRSPFSGNLSLARLVDHEREIAFSFADASLWRVHWLDLTSGETIESDATSTTRPAEVRRRPEGDTLVVTLIWRQCRVGGERFSVHVEIRLPANGSQTEWRLAVDARAMNVFTVQLAELHLAISPPADGTTLRAIVPYRGALEVADPQRTLKHNGAATFIGNKLNAQLFPVYTDGGAGLYLAAHDPNWYYKRLSLEGDGESYHLGLQAFTEDQVTPGRSFLMSFPWVIGLFEGDWYDAGQIYREFAKDQAWLRHGKLAERTDVPSWWKELDLLELHTFEVSDDVNHTVAGFKAVREFYNIPPGGLAVAHWAWFDTFGAYGSSPGFQATLDGLASEGVRGIPYVWSYAYDASHPSYGQDNVYAWTKKDFHGATIFDPFAPWTVVVLDPGVSSWHDHVNAILRRVGTDGVYLDNPYEVHPDFDAFRNRRGHGSHTIAGFHALMTAVRNGRRAENADFVITYESMFEGFIGVADMIAPENPYEYNPVSRDGSAQYVPLYDSVYHDYTVTLIANSKMDFFRAHHFVHLDDAVYTLAHGFSLGKMLSSIESLFELGGVPNHWIYYASVQRYVGALKRFIVARRRYRDFLLLGQLLRPLETSAPSQTMTLIEPRSDEPYTIRAPGVLTSVWKAPDGRLGILLVNYEKLDTNVSFQFDFESYDLVPGQEYRLLDGRTNGVLATVTDDFTHTMALPAVDLRFLILER